MSQRRLDFPQDDSLPTDSRSAGDYLPTATVGPSWQSLLEPFFQSETGKQLTDYLQSELDAQHTIYPVATEVYRAFQFFSAEETAVVILGQDPYHGPGQAHGLAFSVPDGIKLPPSLKNIYKELESDVGVTRDSGDLSDWAKQGVLLLNTALTVRQATAGSHSKKGWRQLTDGVIDFVNQKAKPAVFILWGSDAIAKQDRIDSEKHLVLTSVHPSPLSAYRGFFGSRPFSQANQFLKENGRQEIQW